MKKNITVSGIVQGVGFRYATQQIADDIGITGWVKNNKDGTVQIHAQGENKQLNIFQEKIRNNPTRSSRVDHININILETEVIYPDFSIK
ncbi:acylphosphatase [Virgibacillus sp. DJP39]|uniref:acylphosphatase n=1 Tax=Virgibacillus sp. DJP39 TaxID=3409790 RepID=UPI003BB62590